MSSSLVVVVALAPNTATDVVLVDQARGYTPCQPIVADYRVHRRHSVQVYGPRSGYGAPCMYICTA